MPYLLTERLARRTDGSAREPIAVVASQAGVIRVTACNVEASRLGVRVGMTSAEAKASVPSLCLEQADAKTDRAALESLAAWADFLSPVVHIEDDRTLLVDITGCQRLFRGERNLMNRAVAGLRDQGFTLRAAIADTPGASLALAWAHPEPVVIADKCQDVALLAPLPVWSLRLDAKTVALLEAVGVASIASLLHLPRASLPSRFGDALLLRLSQVLGETPELLTPFRPPPLIRQAVRFGVATDRFDVLAEAVRRLTASFCAELAQREAGVRRLHVTFHYLCNPPTTIELNLSRATRAPRHIDSLLQTRLSDLCLPGQVEGVTVWTRHVEQVRHRQGHLFGPTGFEDEALTELIDRLRVGLGSDSVVYAQPVADHQPERAYRYVEEGKSAIRNPQSAIGLVRPLRLLTKPREVQTMALVPEGPPTWFRWGGVGRSIVHCLGPERIETGWWRGRLVQRDYFRVTTEPGHRFWLFRQRDTRRWFVHGIFD